MFENFVFFHGKKKKSYHFCLLSHIQQAFVMYIILSHSIQQKQFQQPHAVFTSLHAYYLTDAFLLLFPEEGYVRMYLKGRPITMFMPKDQVDSYCLEARADLPGNKLKLDWVYPFIAAFPPYFSLEFSKEIKKKSCL